MNKKKKIRSLLNLKNFIVFSICAIFIGLNMWNGPHPAFGGENKTISSESMKVLESALQKAKDNPDGTVNIYLDEDRERVQQGDLVAVIYSLALENGKLLRTNNPDFINDSAKAKAEEYEKNSVSGPMFVLAGQRDEFPGIHGSILGMKSGETKRISISHEDAYGPRSEEKVKTFSSVRSVPKIMRISLKTFQEQHSTMPKKGDLVNLMPYFPQKIADITDDEITLQAEINGPFTSRDSFGDAKIVADGDNITITLEPKLGADFETGSEKGKIVSIDEKSFTVDFNSSLAGKSLALDVSVASIIKSSSITDWEISWIDEHDNGLSSAERSGKPAVLVLYADWCPWCKKLFSETFKDPRVTLFRDNFLWIKTNSDRDQSLKELYGQDKFPFIVLMDSNGKVLKKLSGFKHAYDLRDELELALKKLKETSTAKKEN